MDELLDEDRAELDGIVARATAAAGFAPLSDQLAADLRDGVGTTVVADDGRPAAFVQISPRAGAWTMQLVVDPAVHGGEAGDRIVAGLVEDAVAAVRAGGGGRVEWWVFESGGESSRDGVAAAAGFTLGRELHQMRRSLPADAAATVATRAFRPGADDEAWLTLNNRAFAGHPEQGAWDQTNLDRRMSEAWFDPDGFRLYDDDGRLAAFCWTKLHPPDDGEPPTIAEGTIGEIYVIGVDPDLHGRGLGRELTLAGLDWIAARGVDTAMLYVDAANAAAVGLYRRLGFTVTRTDRAYRRDV